jgi:hypothetical protein
MNTYKGREITKEMKAKVMKEYRELKACSKSYLQSEVERRYRVYNSTELTKMDMVFELLRSKFGDRVVEETI